VSKKFSLFLGAALVAALTALVAVLFFAPEPQSAEANSPVAPMSVDVEFVEAVAAPVQIDPETGLPMGAVMFQAGDQTCLAVPGYDLECWCPCETGACLEVSSSVALTSSVEITATEPVSTSIPTFVPEGDDDDGNTDIPDRDPDPDPDPEPETDPETDPDEGDDTPDESDEDDEGDEGDDTPDEDDDEGDEPKKKSKCNQGVGNGAEGCDPGNSNHNQPSNDEGEGDEPGSPGRGGGNGKGKGKDK